MALREAEGGFEGVAVEGEGVGGGAGGEGGHVGGGQEGEVGFLFVDVVVVDIIGKCIVDFEDIAVVVAALVVAENVVEWR